MGVAKLKNAVYILCRSPSETIRNSLQPPSVIWVYSDRQPFTLTSEIKLDMLTSPFDMVSSELNNCIYVTDLHNVYQSLSVSQELQRFLSWKWNPHTLSVSSVGRLILGKDGNPCCLERYTAKAELVDRIQLPTDVASVKHAVEMSSSGNFLLLLEWATDADPTKHPVSRAGRIEVPDWKQTGSRGIYEMTVAGKIVRWFCPRTQSYQLDDPRHLVLDSFGQVFVADHSKDRMMQFDSVLNLVQVIETPGMFGPKRLFYDEAKQQLWIGHSKQMTTEKDVHGNINICILRKKIHLAPKNTSLRHFHQLISTVM